MSLTFLLLVMIAVLVTIGIITKKLNILKLSAPDKNGNQKPVGIQWKPVTFILLTVLAALFQPMNYEVISVGHKGLLINLLGDKRGASNTEEVSGVVFYNKYTQEIQEVPLDQRHIEYPESIIVAKGGFPCPIKPSFNYSVKESTASDMFTNLRSTYKKGGLEAIQEGWLNNAIIGAINDVANRHSIDYLFNNRETYEAEILSEVNKRIGKWFMVSQLKTNIQPPKAIRQSIEDKATADADAIKAEAQARVAQADAQRKIQLAKGDSASMVIRAQAEAKAISLKQQEITPTYVEYQRVLKWDGVMPSTVLGSGSGTLLNVGK
ncbi:SPFH domain-containing protein [Chryseobacterium sp. R2A-55]|uniref:SPFH domain-containing protein n=1 Tax=Chryseobacterium sp. R2A-55 TaxID=2744445 RepID=UPI001EFF4FB4|nr:SPFH domain-containing protein [Chryseobacterium sp. R2A-55]